MRVDHSNSTKRLLEISDTLIVDTTQIFAEFDSSATPQDNIRDFISYAGTFLERTETEIFYDCWKSNQMVPNFPHSISNSQGAYSPYHNRIIIMSEIFMKMILQQQNFYIGRIPCKERTVKLENYF